MIKNCVVWRVEDETGCGPYTRRNYFGGSSDKPHSWELRLAIFGRYGRQIPPLDDFPEDVYTKSISEGWLFGFPTVECGQKWFGFAGLAILERYGYKLVPKRAKTASISKSGTQLMFEPE